MESDRLNSGIESKSFFVAICEKDWLHDLQPDEGHHLIAPTRTEVSVLIAE
jgi:hypothetical protein